jgi:hypothetical protein
LCLVLTVHFTHLAWQDRTARYAAPAALATLASGLVRPEGALVGAVACAVAWTRARKGYRRIFAARLGLLLVAPGLVYVAARWYYFGYLVPNTVHNKFAPAGLWTSLVYFRNWAASIGVAVWLLILVSSENKARIVIPLGLAAVAGAPYLVANVESMGYAHRFLAPASALVFLASAEAVELLKRRQPLVRGALVAGIVGLAFVPWWHQAQKFEAYFVDHYAAGLQRAHITIGRLSRQACAEGRVAVWEDAGAIPYYSGWTALDIGGLVDAFIQHHGLSAEYLFSFKPDVIVVTEESPYGQNRRGRAKWERLSCHPDCRLYERVGAFPFSPTSVQAVYVRRDSPRYHRIRQLVERSPQNVDFDAAGPRCRPEVRILTRASDLVPEQELPFASQDSCAADWAKLSRRYLTVPGRNYRFAVEVCYENPACTGTMTQTIEIAGRQVLSEAISASDDSQWHRIDVPFVAQADETELAVRLQIETDAGSGSADPAGRMGIRAAQLHEAAGPHID